MSDVHFESKNMENVLWIMIKWTSEGRHAEDITLGRF